MTLKGRENKLMKKKFTKRLLSWVMVAAMVISMLPISAMATGTGSGNVAKIGDTQYATLDAAVAAAADGATIEMLADGVISSMPTKTLTFTGNGTISVTGKEWNSYPAGKTLTLDGKGVNFEWREDTGSWLMMGVAGTFTVTNGATATFYVNSDTATRTAIYGANGTVINVLNGSTLQILGENTWGHDGDGFASDGRMYINVKNQSTFLIDGTNRGFVNSPVLTVEDSNFTVQNCTANASNGGNFTFDNSKINFSDNNGHGISSTNLIIKNHTTVTTNNNIYYGTYASSSFKMDGTSTLTIKNSATERVTGGTFAGLRISGTGSIADGAKIVIEDNGYAGFWNSANTTFGQEVDLTIIHNGKKEGNGGGIYNSGTLVLPSDAVIYNNYANTSGADICSTNSITFGQVGSNWALEECEPDHLIDGWYVDGARSDSSVPRWNADAEDEADNFIKPYEFEGDSTTVTGSISIRAAHGTDPIDKTSYPGLDKQISDANEPEWSNDDVDAAAGQDVNFKLTSNVPDDLLNYIIPDVDEPEIVTPAAANALVPVKDRGEYHLTFHDKMNDMLVDATVPVVTLDRPDGQEDVTLTAGTHYTYTTDTGDGCDFHIAIDLVALYNAGIIKEADIEAATPIVVTYNAKLSDDATAGTYENEAWTTVDENEWISDHDKVYVNTYKLSIFKYDQATDEALPGATFTLYNDENCADEHIVATDLSENDGFASFDGLDAGTYYLKETEAPEGYVCSDTVVTIIIGEDGQQNAENIVNVKFANSQIPHTGGMGTTLFSIVGGALIATAGVIFVISRKKRARSAA